MSDLEALLKQRLIAKTWLAMYAGDVGNVEPVTSSVSDALDLLPQPTRQEVAKVFELAMRAHRKTLIEAQVLASLGITLEEFWANGRLELGPVAFEEMRFRVNEVRVGCEFLVAGYDGWCRPGRDGEEGVAAVPLGHVLQRLRVHQHEVVDQRQRLATSTARAARRTALGPRQPPRPRPAGPGTATGPTRGRLAVR